MGVVAQAPRKLIPAGIAQHYSILGGKAPRDLEDAGSKEGLLLLLDCCHCPGVQPQLTLHRYTQDPSLPVPAPTTCLLSKSFAILSADARGCLHGDVRGKAQSKTEGISCQRSGVTHIVSMQCCRYRCYLAIQHMMSFIVSMSQITDTPCMPIQCMCEVLLSLWRKASHSATTVPVLLACSRQGLYNRGGGEGREAGTDCKCEAHHCICFEKRVRQPSGTIGGTTTGL